MRLPDGKTTWKKIRYILLAWFIFVTVSVTGSVAYAAYEDVTKSGVTDSKSDDNENDEENFEDREYLTSKDFDKLKISFEKESYAVVTYDTIKVNVKTNIPDKFCHISYGISSHYISIDEYSNSLTLDVRGSYEGESTLSVYAAVDYCDSRGEYKGCKTFSADVKVKVLDYTDHELTIGEQFRPEYRDYDEYKDMKYEFDKPGIAVIADDDTITAATEGYTRIYLTDGKDKRIYVGAITVRGTGMAMSETTVTRALGSIPYALSVINMTPGTVTWSTSNALVAVVDSWGVVTPCASGEAVITATHKTLTGIETSYTCVFKVTSPVLSVNVCNVAKNHSMELTVMGTTGVATWTSSDKNVVSVYSSGYASRYIYNDILNNSSATNPSATIYGNKKGTAQITVQIDGITLVCTVTVTNPKLNKSFYLVTKGTKQTLKINGINAASTIKYQSSDPKVVTVTDKGVIKAKKTGFAVIDIEVDNAVITASINVGSVKAVKAVNNALKVEGATYSQARRMQKGYYDCSSLVWRCYSPLGMYFGDRHYAPVAANEARYLANHKKTVPVKYVKNLKKLRPGDLFFFKRSSNGRYKNIYHVAIYMGREGNGNYSYGKIIHADGTKVSQWYMYNESNIVVVGRPFS